MDGTKSLQDTYPYVCNFFFFGILWTGGLSV